jgi:hypothetical protein
MRRELYTDEFRTFKYLQFNAYYEMVGNMVNGLRGEGATPWPFRVEFVDQLLDLYGETIYIVNGDRLLFSKDFYEDATLSIIEDAHMTEGYILTPDLGRRLDESRISDIEHNYTDDMFLLFSERAKKEMVAGANFDAFSDQVFKIEHLPVVPKKNIGYNAIFARRDVAEEYRFLLTHTLRNKKAALSTISRYF